MAETFKNARLVAGTAASDIYTAGSGITAIVIGAQIANVGTASVEVDVWFTDSSAADAITRLVKDVIVPSQAALAPVAGKLVLETGDKIRALASADDDAEIVVSVLEIS